MSAILKILLAFVCFICLWNLSTLPEMIVINSNDTNLHDAFVFTGVVIPIIILVSLGLLVLLFSLLGVVLVTSFIVVLTLILVGLSFSWPLLITALILYWLFKQTNRQKLQD